MYPRVSHYEVLKKIGCGGMGVVFLARDIQLQRPVALKFLSPKHATKAKSVIQFFREARAAGRLDHPNIGVIHEVGKHRGQPFICMAYYDGETLRERIDRSFMVFAEIEWMLTQIAQGLSAVHRARVVHRDLKPSNVMITGSGQVKILDFGLARILDDAGPKTPLFQSGTLAGTLPYISPELALGHEFDHRSDLWSLGVMGYEMITSVVPFDAASSEETLGQIVSNEPEPLNGVRDGVPEHLRWIVERLLDKKPYKRFQTAEEVKSALSEPGEARGIAQNSVARPSRLRMPQDLPVPEVPHLRPAERDTFVAPAMST